MKEIWRKAAGYEDLYMVSNLGRVMSMDYRHTGKPKILKPIEQKGGYMSIHRKSHGKRIAIHRLVAETFIPNPKHLPCVNHINEDKQDNSVENLEWCDHFYNNTYGDRIKKMIKTREGRAEWKTEFRYVVQCSKDGEVIAKFPSCTAAGRAIGIDRTGINNCALGKQKTAGGYKWFYE